MKIDLVEIPEFYKNYVRCTGNSHLLESLESGSERFTKIMSSISEDQAEFRYEPGKWSIKEMLQHIIDAERVFTFRALSFSRGDTTPLPGFEQDDWMKSLPSSSRPLSSLIEEFSHLRVSTIDFFGSLDENQLKNTGTASGVNFSVLGIGFITSGHLLHHLNVLEERYL